MVTVICSATEGRGHDTSGDFGLSIGRGLVARTETEIVCQKLPWPLDPKHESHSMCLVQL